MRSLPTLLLTLALCASAAAQGSDCKLAQSPREHAVCSVPRLSALDTEIATAYKALRDQLSPQSAALVESDQNEWLHWIDLICPAKSPGVEAKSDTILSHCLQDQYAARAHDLKQVVHIGTAIIFPRAHFLYKPADQSNQLSIPDYPGFGYGALRWPQIDIKPDSKPDSKTGPDAAWNKAVKAQAAKSGSGAFHSDKHLTFDSVVNPLEILQSDYTLVAANGRLIEVNLITTSYLWVPGAHPITTRNTFLWWLDRNREFTSDDVFPPLGPWRELLVSLAAGHLQNNDRLKPLLRSEPGLEAAVQQSALQPSNWTLTVNGLTITFPQGVVASDAAGTPRVYIPWEELKPYLEPTLNPSTLPARLPQPTPSSTNSPHYFSPGRSPG